MPKAALDTKPRLECYFLDVGQGDATLIVTPARKKILVDGGKGVARGRIGEAEQALIGGLINLVMNSKIVVKAVPAPSSHQE